MLIGYARVYKQEQDNLVQIDALRKEGCELIFEDKVSEEDGIARNLKNFQPS